MIVANLLLLSLVNHTPPPPTVEVAAWLEADQLEVGQSYSIQVEFGLPDGALVEGGGLPEALLQIDCPTEVKLAGPYYDTLKEQADHEHLMMPYERLFEGSRSEVRFELTSQPKAETTVGLIVVGYADPEGEAPPFFFRRRVELALTPGAESVDGDDRNSKWGRDENILHIGDRVQDVELPQLGGETYALKDLLDSTSFLVSTYRAFW